MRVLGGEGDWLAAIMEDDMPDHFTQPVQHSRSSTDYGHTRLEQPEGCVGFAVMLVLVLVLASLAVLLGVMTDG